MDSLHAVLKAHVLDVGDVLIFKIGRLGGITKLKQVVHQSHKLVIYLLRRWLNVLAKITCCERQLIPFEFFTERRSPTFSDCQYVKEIPFSFDYCLLSNFTYFLCIIKYSLSFVKIVS